MFEADLDTLLREVQGVPGAKHISHVLLRGAVMEAKVLVHQQIGLVQYCSFTLQAKTCSLRFTCETVGSTDVEEILGKVRALVQTAIKFD